MEKQVMYLKKQLKPLVGKNFVKEILQSEISSLVLFYNHESIEQSIKSKNALKWTSFIADKIKIQLKNENIQFFSFDI
jgi:hypothetical protein